MAESNSTMSCKNIKSQRNPKEKCINPATHDGFCGIHYRKPVPWVPMSPENIAKRVIQRNNRKRSIKEEATKKSESAKKIQNWFRFYKGFHMVRKHGIAFYDRSVTVNDSEFFSTDKITDISGTMFFSYMDSTKNVYGFDIRSIYTLLYRAELSGELCQNPFNREPLSESTVKRIKEFIKWLRKQNLPTEWAPLEPPTPEQQWRMKVVDLFNIINGLNYYSSPDWFIDLSHRSQRVFYIELHAIWTHRAGLSIEQKNMIVPNYVHRMFRHPPWSIGNQTIESLQKLNMNCIKLMITSAEDRNDRILGAMYVVSALTIVNTTAREAYPWLYESIRDDSVPNVREERVERVSRLHQLFGLGWLNEVLNIQTMPPLALPAAASETT